LIPGEYLVKGCYEREVVDIRQREGKALAKVYFPDYLLHYTSKQREVTVTASNYRDLVRQLEQRFPGIEEILLSKVAVAIDGEIVHDPYFDELQADSEVYFLPRLVGG